MIKKYTLFFFAFFCFGYAVNAQSLILKEYQENNAKRTNTSLRMASHSISLPLKAVQYEWQGSNWVYQSDIIYTYDIYGNIASETVYKGELDSLTKTVIVPSENFPQYTGFNSYVWNNVNDEWELENGLRSFFTMDAQERVTQQIMQDYDPDLGEWVNMFKSSFNFPDGSEEYNAKTHYNWDGTQWIEGFKENNIIWEDYSSKQMLSYVQQKYDQGSWVDELRINYAYTGNNYIGIFESYSPAGWELALRQTYSEDANGNSVKLNEDYENGSWVNLSRESYYEYEHSLFPGYKDEDWINGAWEIEEFEFYTNTYSSGNLTESICETGTGTTVDSKTKTIYSDFIYSLPTSIIKNHIVESLVVYPNPAKEILFINSGIHEDMNIKFYNSQNIQFLEEHLINGMGQLNVSELPNGVYFLQGETASGKFMISKIVIH